MNSVKFLKVLFLIILCGFFSLQVLYISWFLALCFYGISGWGSKSASKSSDLIFFFACLLVLFYSGLFAFISSNIKLHRFSFERMPFMMGLYWYVGEFSIEDVWIYILEGFLCMYASETSIKQTNGWSNKRILRLYLGLCLLGLLQLYVVLYSSHKFCDHAKALFK